MNATAWVMFALAVTCISVAAHSVAELIHIATTAEIEEGRDQ